MSQASKFSKFNRQYVDEKVDYAEVIKNHLLGLSNNSFVDDPSQHIKFVNAVERLISISYPLFSPENIKELEALETRCDEEVNEILETNNAKTFKFRSRGKENEVKHKYAELKMRKVLVFLKPVLANESMSVLLDPDPDYEEED
jgi:hypothetical protein